MENITLNIKLLLIISINIFCLLVCYSVSDGNVSLTVHFLECLMEQKVLAS